MVAVNQGRWRLIFRAGSPRRSELYDKWQDPLEQLNLAAEQPEMLEELIAEAGNYLDSPPPPWGDETPTVEIDEMQMKQLEAGQVVEGLVELTGEQQSGDQFASWKFQVINAVNDIMQEWEGNISSSQSHKFSFTATMDGRYIIKISHISRYSKNLNIEVKPPGWAIMGTQ